MTHSNKLSYESLNIGSLAPYLVPCKTIYTVDSAGKGSEVELFLGKFD